MRGAAHDMQQQHLGVDACQTLRQRMLQCLRHGGLGGGRAVLRH